VASFNRIQVGSTFEVLVRQGETPGVVVHADDNLRDELDVRTSGTALVLRLKPGSHILRANLTADVTVRELVDVRVTGASKVRFSGDIRADVLHVTASGASRIEQGTLTAKTLALRLSGASSLTLKGAADRLTIYASGSSQAGVKDLRAQDVDVRLAGGSSASIHADKTITAVVTSASELVYRGDAILKEQTSTGASSIRRGQG
jgi:hypothetical protein